MQQPERPPGHGDGKPDQDGQIDVLPDERRHAAGRERHAEHDHGPPTVSTAASHERVPRRGPAPGRRLQRCSWTRASCVSTSTRLSTWPRIEERRGSRAAPRGNFGGNSLEDWRADPPVLPGVLVAGPPAIYPPGRSPHGAAEPTRTGAATAPTSTGPSTAMHSSSPPASMPARRWSLVMMLGVR